MAHDNYGRLFRSMYTGSMYGAGAIVFAVWTWIISHKDENGHLEINCTMLSHTLGEFEADISKALDYLLNPDPRSRTKTEDGRRLIKLGEFEYVVVNHASYEEKGKDRTEYWRKYKAEKRAEIAKTAESPHHECDVHSGQSGQSTKSTPVAVHGTVPVTVKKEKDFVDKSTELESDFEKVRTTYPGTVRGLKPEYDNFLKVCKKEKLKPSEIIPLLTPAIESQIAWRKSANGNFRPEWKAFTPWINQMFWTMELPKEVLWLDTDPTEEDVDRLFPEWAVKEG